MARPQQARGRSPTWASHEDVTSNQLSPTRAAKQSDATGRWHPTSPRWRMWLLPLGIVISLLLLFHPSMKATSTKNFTYTSFVSEVTRNQISTATITSTGAVTGKLHNGSSYTSQVPTALNDDALSPLLLRRRVQVVGTNPSATSAASVLLSLLPLVLIIGVFMIGRPVPASSSVEAWEG